MPRVSRRSLSRSAVAAYLCICTALLLLLVLTMWESYRDMQLLRKTLLDAEVNRLRSHAERTVGRIERDLEIRGAENLGDLNRDGWLQRHWGRILAPTERRLHAAVVNNQGDVLLHSDPSRTGKRLSRHWYRRVLFNVGNDVFETRSPVLALGSAAYDVRLPIEIDSRELGEYHVGFDVDWFETWSAQQQAALLWRRGALVVGVLLVVLLATTSLYYIATHSVTLRRAVNVASVERASEVGRLAGGLAHEIRNPLHAIQLNLHTLRRQHEQGADISPDETSKMLEQSTREIDRIEQLMRQLVGFAAPDEPQNDVINLTSEIRDVVEFIKQQMLDANISIRQQLPPGPVRVEMDRGRLRQIMLNLLQNAQQAMNGGGQIDVKLSRRRSRAEITVADNGPGVDDDEQTRIFEPFYSSKSDGSGLGLALVKRFVDEVDGKITCEPNPGGGAKFRIVLSEIRPSERK